MKSKLRFNWKIKIKVFFLGLLVLVRKGINKDLDWLVDLLVLCCQFFDRWSNILFVIPVAVLSSNLRRSTFFSTSTGVVVVGVFDLFFVTFVFPKILIIAWNCFFFVDLSFRCITFLRALLFSVFADSHRQWKHFYVFLGRRWWISVILLLGHQECEKLHILKINNA